MNACMLVYMYVYKPDVIMQTSDVIHHTPHSAFIYILHHHAYIHFHTHTHTDIQTLNKKYIYTIIQGYNTHTDPP
jgi:hypothetical protein